MLGWPGREVDRDLGPQLVREWCRSAPLFLADLGKLVDRPVVVNPGLVHRERAGATEVEWIHPIHLAERVEEVFTS